MTIKDVAARCGVSVSTVSRVLNRHPDVSASVRARVLAAVEECNYVPNNSARSLVSSRSTAIGVVVRGVGNPFLASIIPVLEKEIDRRGYTMVLHQITSRDNELQKAAILQREKKLLGIIFLGGNSDYTEQDVRQISVPFVCCTYTNSFGTLPPERYSSVSIQDGEEAQRAVELLWERGHRAIAALIPDADNPSIGQLRWKGYQRALSRRGLEADPQLVSFTEGYGMDDAYQGVCRLLDRGGPFTALFCISDSMAMAAIKALSDRGRQVPRDCSVIAIDGLEQSLYAIPTLTTMVQPAEEMGRESVAMLAELIEGTGEHRHLVMKAALREGESVRAI